MNDRENGHPLRILLVLAGLLCTMLAVAGIFLPVLPTVPFLLLAAACFARSSDRLHQWLLRHPRLGPVVLAYQAGEGIPRRAKISAIALIWISIPLSAWFVPFVWVKVLLLGVGAAVTIYLLRQPDRPG